MIDDEYTNDNIKDYEDDLYFGSDERFFQGEDNLDEAVDPNSISLSSFRIKKKLNSKIWTEDNRLNDNVRANLLKIADNFWKSCSISFTGPTDVIFVGSLANYNWSKNSDIDLHLVVDFSQIGDNKEFVTEYFKDKKTLWNEKHAEILIHKFPVELYVQDISEQVESSAVYSVLKNKWIEEPVRDALGTFANKISIKKKAADFMNQVDELEAEFDGTVDPYELENLEARLMGLIERVRYRRKKALESDGEMSDDNIVYKVLRRSGYIDKVYDLYRHAFDTRLSL